MSKMVFAFVLLIGVTFAADVNRYPSSKLAMLSDKSICCTIPELAPEAALDACYNPRTYGLCEQTTCIFKNSKWLTADASEVSDLIQGSLTKQAINATVDKEAFRVSLRAWGEKNSLWLPGVNIVERDCINRQPRQVLDHSCEPYDMVSCTAIALLKKCPDSSWICGN